MSRPEFKEISLMVTKILNLFRPARTFGLTLFTFRVSSRFQGRLTGDLYAPVVGVFYCRARRFIQTIIGLTGNLKKALSKAEDKGWEGGTQAENKELAREWLTAILRSISDGVIAMDMQGQVLFLNKAAQDLTGWSHEEAQGRTLSDVFQVRDEGFASVWDMVGEVLRDGGIRQVEGYICLEARDGSHRRVSGSTASVKDRNSRIIGAVLVLGDETEKQKLLEEAHKAEKLDFLGVLASGIAHDFNNILTAILGNITSAKLSLDTPDKAQGKLEEAEKAAYQASGLSLQLMTFTRGGKQVRENIDLAELLRKSVEFALRGSNTGYEFQLPEGLWPVHADSGQIEQVIYNLVFNACQAMPQGGVITVTGINLMPPADQGADPRPGPMVQVSVADQGQGIEKTDLSKIFDPFFTTKAHGTGLGLASCTSILKDHGGHIEVQSTPGKGSTFHFYLPALPGQTVIQRQQEQAASDAGTGGRILIMDDEELILGVSADLFEHLGYEVTVARDGEQAAAFYSQAMSAGRAYDLVILDLTVPGGMGGKDAVREILRLDPEARVVISSGYSSSPVVINFRKHGFVGVLVKPYHIDQVRELLQNLIDPNCAFEE